MTTLQRVGQQAPHNFFRPFGHPKGRHAGEDTGHASGDDIYAAADGTVTYVYTGIAYNGGWGRRIVIEHAPGVATTYNHMDAGGVLVRYGQKVKAGQLIARQGSSGKGNGKHLHMELYHDGIRIDPRPFFEGRHLPGTSAPAPAGKPTVGVAQRVVRHPVRRRLEPTSTSKNVTSPKPLLSAGTVGNFTGFIRGQRVTLNGITSNVWFRGISGHYFWAGNFTTQSTKGLKDLGTWKAGSKPKPTPQKQRFVDLGTKSWITYGTREQALNASREDRQTITGGQHRIDDGDGPYKIFIGTGNGNGYHRWIGSRHTQPRVVRK